MSSVAWYLGCSAEEVGSRAILVGDRARVKMISGYLDNTEWLNEERGLTTATGTYRGQRITVNAFGMGAPIAAIVLHELRTLGVHTFLRLGTAMSLPPTKLGQLVLADGAIRGESTSGTYVPEGYPAIADHDLGASLRQRLGTEKLEWITGIIASHDGFYTELFALDKAMRPHVEARQDVLQKLGVVATDMETSAVLAVGRALGARASSLCLASVEGRTGAKLEGAERRAREERLIAVGLDAIVGVGEVPSIQPNYAGAREEEA